MSLTVSNETAIDDPALIERVAIAIFEKTQGSWEIRQRGRQRMAAARGAGGHRKLFELHRGTRSDFRRLCGKRQPLLELIRRRS